MSAEACAIMAICAFMAGAAFAEIIGAIAGGRPPRNVEAGDRGRR